MAGALAPPPRHRLPETRRRQDPAPRPTAGFATSPSSPIQENKTMSIATASDLEIAPARPLLMPLAAAAGCVVLADWLFYGWDVGISLALFLGVLGIVAVAANRVAAPRRVQIAMAAIFLAGLLALVEEVNALSVTVGVLATATVRHRRHGAPGLVLAIEPDRCRDLCRSRSISIGRRPVQCIAVVEGTRSGLAEHELAGGVDHSAARRRRLPQPVQFGESVDRIPAGADRPHIAVSTCSIPGECCSGS